MNPTPGTARIRSAVLVSSALGWILLFTAPTGAVTVAHCGTVFSATEPPSFQNVVPLNLVGSLAAGWTLMLIAMMSPTLFAPLWHIHLRSFSHRRMTSSMLFLASYGVVWMIAGAV